MSSIFEEIKSFFSGPSIEKCSKEEKKENDKHDIKVNEEIERHKSALKKIKETASCKLKTPNTNTIEDTEDTEDTKSIIDTTVMNPLQKVEPPSPKDEPLDTKDVGLEFPSNQENQEPPKQEQKQEFRGGRKRRTRRPRKRSGKNTKRSR